jgi:predicted permease
MEKKRPKDSIMYELDADLTASATVLKPKEEAPKIKCMQKVKKIMNPPIVATLAAVPLALIPYVKSTVFLGSGAILGENVMKAITMFGACSSPVITLILGSNLCSGYSRTADISK